MLRYALPAKLSAVWDALMEQKLFNIATPHSSMAVFAAELLLAANTASDDPRMELDLEDTKRVELRVAAGCSDAVLSSHLQGGGRSLTGERVCCCGL
jgi:hypothetical protein